MMDMLGSLKSRHPDQRRDDDQNGEYGDADQSPEPVVQIERNGRAESNLGIVSAEAVVAKHRQRTPEEDDLTHYGERNGQIHQRLRQPQFPEKEDCEGKDDMEHFGSNTEVQPASLGHYDTSILVCECVILRQSSLRNAVKI